MNLIEFQTMNCKEFPLIEDNPPLFVEKTIRGDASTRIGKVTKKIQEIDTFYIR